MSKSYKQYCPIACALDRVGERWSLLIVRELLEHGQLRYSDLHAALEGCGTNILASRLRDLEHGCVVRRRKLPPPASATVYELTEYGLGLAPVLHQLAHWGARAMPPPTPADLEPGWLEGALRMAFPPQPPGTRVELQVGDEVASLADGEVVAGPVEDAEARIVGDAVDFYHLVVDRDLDAIAIHGSRRAVKQLLDSLPPATPRPAAAELASA